MAISHSAVSRKGLLLVLLLFCVNAFSSAANTLTRSDIVSVTGLFAADYQKYQDKKQDKPKKPEIKEVPKARKQLKPAAVKPKVKPIRIVKPKIKKH